MGRVENYHLKSQHKVTWRFDSLENKVVIIYLLISAVGALSGLVRLHHTYLVMDNPPTHLVRVVASRSDQMQFWRRVQILDSTPLELDQR